MINMFTDNTFADRDNCSVCRWRHSRMCPKSYEYVGRFMGNPDEIRQRNLCHKFVPSAMEDERRQEIIYDKLHENLEIGD